MMSDPPRAGAQPGHVPGNKGKTYPIEVLTPGEVAALMAACSARAPTGLRHRALIAVLWRTGLRVQEALDLYPKDIDEELGAVTVLRGKGSKRRVVGVDPMTLAVLERWLAARAKVASRRGWRPALHPIFCTLAGEPVKSTHVRVVLHRLAADAEISKRVHPHGLRHTLAAEMANEGVPVHMIQQLLGHADLATTSRYINHLAPHELVRTMRARSWSFEPR